MTDETDIIERVVDIQQLIVNPYTSAVLNAKEQLPESILDGWLPLFLNIVSPSPSPRQKRGADGAAKTIILEMRLFVKKAGQGFEYEAQTLTEQLIEPVENAFDARPRLELNDAGLVDVDNAFIVSTIQNAFLPYGGKNYVGLTFNLQVTFTRVTRQV
jgi:hypothetical protein